MCDNKNELHQSEYDKSKDYTSTRLDLDIIETTDSYPEFDFLDLLRNLQVKEKKVKQKNSSEVSSNKSNFFSDEDSDIEALAKIYEEKYGTCNDYAELGEGYDEEDSFIDNSDAINDLVPSGIQTEFGGFYINRGKLNFVKEENSSSSASEDVDKFLAHNRLNTRRITSDDESDEKEICKGQSNILQSSGNTSNLNCSSNMNNNNNNNNNNINNLSNLNNNNNNNNNNLSNMNNNNNNDNDDDDNDNGNSNGNSNNIINSNHHNSNMINNNNNLNHHHHHHRHNQNNHHHYNSNDNNTINNKNDNNNQNHNNSNNINSSNNSNSNSSNNKNNGNNNNNNNNHHNNNNNYSSNMSSTNLYNNIIKSRKRSKEYLHKSKKIRKTATPKIPDHLLHKKPFPGSLEYRKNINEFKKNRLKTVESDKKCNVSNSVVNSCNNNDSDNNNSHNINISTFNNNTINNNSNNNNNNNINNNNNNSNINSSCNTNNINNNEEDIDTDKNEGDFTKQKILAVKELLKEEEDVCEEVEIGQKGIVEKQQTSSSSDSSESSTSDSDSYTSEDTPTEKEKIPLKLVEEIPPNNTAINGSISKDITAKSFAHLSDSLKELIAKVFEISKEEKNKIFNSKLNSLFLSLDDKLRELPMAERNAVLEHVAEILQMKKDNITKRIKKLLVLQEETKMSAPLRQLKEAVDNLMPLLKSNYFHEYTKAAGTRSIDPGSLPQRKFPWNEELRRYLREIVQYRQNCYYIIRPRKESLVDYIRNFMETKVRHFWPKEWMTVDILLEEGQVATLRQMNDKQKTFTKILGTQNSSNVAQKKATSSVPAPNVSNRKQPTHIPASTTTSSHTTSRKPSHAGIKNPDVKSILIPRKTPQCTSSGNNPSKSNFSASSLTTLNNLNQGSRLQVILNRLNIQEYFDQASGSQTSICRNSHQQISPSRSQQSVSPNRLVKTSSPNSVLNSNAFRSNVSQKSTSPNTSTKSISSSVRNCNNQQSVLKTIGVHSGSVSSVKTSNSVTISSMNESLFKDLTPSPEVLNLTKNSSVHISKVKDNCESRSGRSNSPSIGIPLLSGITISPTSASPSAFLAKPQKQIEKNPDVKINVSITKQDTGVSLPKEKRENVLSINVKREGPLQNIPDCISVTSKVVPNERPKYEHVRKRALHEYHQQQHSPERLKYEEKKMKTEENLLTDIDMKESRLDDKNFSKIFDSVIAKTSETVRKSESASSQVKMDRYNSVSVDSEMSGVSSIVKNSTVGIGQFKNHPTTLRDVRERPKEKPFYSGGNLEEKTYGGDSDERSKPTKEQRVQMEMDRVMQNLVELSREKNPEYDFAYPSSPSGSSGLKSSSFQEPYQKIMYK